MTENRDTSRAELTTGQPSTSDGEQPRGSERPFLQRPQGVLAVAGGVVTIVAGILGLLFLLFPDIQPEPTPESAIELMDFDIDKESNIQADWQVDEGSLGKGVIKDWKASFITITLRNKSNNPVLVSQATLNFSSMDELGCPYGAGGTEIYARYDIKVPGEARAPFEMVRKMKYTIPPHKQERVAFTVGQKFSGEGALPLVYIFKINLDLDDGSRIEVPEMTYMDSSFTEAVLWFVDDAVKQGDAESVEQCVQKQARKARKLIEDSDHVSPELKKYSAKLNRLANDALRAKP
ncbi:hypothetical protein [Streptomyces sp. NBC_01237]|uniref:hypothetical protein n=1 Tax=Streptomyces sp. NBC_01237 TaxID=2903790 RepID=UPI002DD9C52A|nr:hypothetical protein [Streptomyces sp. NBC_01237]WRZ76409.1 hypothetical protein OG251_34980 [Streptomyces sp. NBC_01237]